MKKNLLEKIKNVLRTIMPLKARQKGGPVLAYISYIYHLHFYPEEHAPQVLSIRDTIRKIKKENLSVVRFGDGEISIIDSHDLGFQSKNRELGARLVHILQSKHDGLMVCIPGIWKKLDNFKRTPFWFTLHHLFKYRFLWENLLPKNTVYGDAFITRPYLTFIDNSESADDFENLFSIWNNKDVVLIEGAQSRLGVGNDMFSRAKSLKRILCPPENAYSKYAEIKEQALNMDKHALVLISLGPTAKVLACDLFMAGFQAIDIGHIDMEYEMFLRKEPALTKVRFKYFNEINERNPEECTDPDYLSQIKAVVE